jgi:acyl-CoA thioester hydrolase
MKELEGYPVSTEIPVQWGDLDAFGHVNNAWFLRYFETGRVYYFRRLGYFETAGHNDGEGPIVASITCNYRRPVFFPDTLVVGVRVRYPRNTSFTMEFAILSREQGEIVADGSGVIVYFDYGKSTKVTVPVSLREAISDLEKW